MKKNTAKYTGAKKKYSTPKMAKIRRQAVAAGHKV